MSAVVVSFLALLLIGASIKVNGSEHSGARVDDAANIKTDLAEAIAQNNSRATFQDPTVNSTGFSAFIQQLYNTNRPSNGSSVSSWKPFGLPPLINTSLIVVKPDETAAHDESQSSSPGPITQGLSNFLLVLSNLSNRPLSDQSVASNAGGAISGGIAAVQETVSQLGSSIQNGLNSAFSNNQANGVSASTSWNPVRPISSAVGSVSVNKPSYCPSSCTMLCGIPQRSASLRIVGGTEVTPANKYPWIALLQYYDQNVGTGTLINDRVVLTSGTVVSNMVIFKQIKVIFGVFDPKSTSEGSSRKVYTVTKAKLHPQYSDANVLDYNIGLLQLATPVVITESFMPICLPNAVETFADTEGLLAGWGARELDGEPWKSLQEVTIPLYSMDECRVAYPNSTEDNICGGVFDPAPKDQHKVACDGDGGTGLMYRWMNDSPLLTLAGITINIPGVGCGRAKQPVIFTKLYRYIPWVQSQATGCYCKS
ncbi:coagulation factor XI-like [Anopheles nili]|uniref:coagulation factor XI-like n=1 Tax=Anopheles nili TaxID=185578 RepID=UPI00237C3956|nr:coagulation factor XI-like [Anopheles nili]